MRTTLALAAVLLLVGAGCAPEGDRGDNTTNKPKTPAVTGVSVRVIDNAPAVSKNADNEEEDAKNNEETEEKQNALPTQPAVTGPKTFTMAEVKAKADAGACWTVIKGQVYDLSDFITKHPGGAGAIKSLCGIDGTAKFTAMHGGQPKPEAVLASHLVGAVK